MQTRLERERPAHHNGVIKFVAFEKKYGLILSDAGRHHIVLTPEMSFDAYDGEELVTLESNVHAQGFRVEAKNCKGIRVTFDLQQNHHKGVKKPLKAVNVKVKL